MKPSAWMWAGILASGPFVGSVAAQSIPSASPSPPTPSLAVIADPGAVPHGTYPAPGGAYAPYPDSPYPPYNPSVPYGYEPGAAPSKGSTKAARREADGDGSESGDSGREVRGPYPSSSIAAGASLGSATAVATGGAAGTSAATATAFSVTTSRSPLILPGLFTASAWESAVAVNRIFFGYGYYEGFKVAGDSGLFSGFNLHEFNLGVETAFLDDRASAYVRVPYLLATDNVSGRPIDGLGDISGGVKFVILSDRESGSAATAGFTLSAPTTRDELVTTQRAFNTGAVVPAVTTNATVNPTFLQPWVAGLLDLDGLFIHDYFGGIIPTDDRVSIFINNDLSIGYRVYRCAGGGGLLTSVTPVLEGQFLVPINHQGAPATSSTATRVTTAGGPPAAPNAFNSPSELFLTAGVQLGLGERALLSAGFTLPVMGPRAFDYGLTVGFNFFF